MNAHVKQAIADARRPWGAGWSQITPAMRKALVGVSLLGQFAAMDTEELTTERKAELLTKWQGLADAVLQGEF